MSTAAEEPSWAIKAEANVQQARRFSQRHDNLFEDLPLFPPLMQPSHDSAAPSLTPTSLSAASHQRALLRRPRAGTADAEPKATDTFAAPSISSLNREFDRLFLAYADMREEAGGAPPNGPAIQCSSRAPRRTSAPVAHRPALPQRSRPDSRTSASTAIKRDTVEQQRRPSDVALALPSSRRASAGVLELPLPQVSTLFRRVHNDAPAGTSNAQLKSPLPSLPLEAHTPTAAEGPLRVQSLELIEAEISAAPPVVPVGTATAVGAEELKASQDGSAFSPLPPIPRAKKGAAGTKAASPTPNGREKGRDGRIMVVVRKRPLAADEEGPDCVRVNGPHVQVAVTKQRVDLSSYEEESDYVFDNAYNATASNRDIYTTCVKDLLTVSLAGGSASCFAYGQTGSGKTYTMMGTESESGLYLLAADDLFGRLGASQKLSVCFYEIYRNSLFDLLNRRHPIVLREDANRRVNICGVVWRTVSKVDELWQLVKIGMEQRRTGSTSANEHSSRSHAVLSIRIMDTAHLDFMGVINLVDLAGSERAADTVASDRVTRLESSEINKSLLALKECIRALDEKRKHVPFRGSRLTEVLRDSFTGNSKTVMIATVSPSSHNHEHTNNTLRYAFRVKGLSIASVEPSKARNAPRPYIPVPRSRSTMGAEEKSNLSHARLRNAKRKDSADVRDCLAGSPTTQRHARKRQPHRRMSWANVYSPSDGANNISIATAMSESMEMMELNSTAELRAPRASPQLRDRGNNSHTLNCKGAAFPLSHQAESSEGRSERPIYKEPPSNPLLLSSITHSLTASNFNSSLLCNAPRLPPLNSASSPHVPVNVAALEQRLTHRIMVQLRHDLGKQIEEVLSEKDSTIAALRCENAALRKALERAQREEGRSESLPSLQGIEGQDPGAMLRASYPLSPSVLQEQSCSSASLSSVSDGVIYRVI
ncbi:putative mitotic centromere-associated kinesin (MCAK) [Leptomonas seymouri]|uniref:Kinesin-like protein n=1 Tax=Leptomonas seymouri TaxID=5684 RepID=A0A0N1PGE8_LEPSE|nr:putative mitotic centromere-associated kinesin (MCAK) [Leptomonas seymouri]|eukprot:KPI90335.1 putative mitotic centromere-associated kinesin (MCAK) [Leptomonas seymouri]